MGDVLLELLLSQAISSARRYFQQAAQAELAKQSMEQFRKYMLSVVAQEFTKEIAFNASQYVKSVGAASLTIEPDEGLSDNLEKRFQTALRDFKDWVDAQPKNSPVVEHLLQKYGVNEKSYMGRAVMRPWQVLGGSARPEPWLNRSGTDQRVNDMINAVALRIFEENFSNQP